VEIIMDHFPDGSPCGTRQVLRFCACPGPEIHRASALAPVDPLFGKVNAQPTELF